MRADGRPEAYMRKVIDAFRKCGSGRKIRIWGVKAFVRLITKQQPYLRLLTSSGVSSRLSCSGKD